MNTRTFHTTVAVNGHGPVTVTDHLYGLEYVLVDRDQRWWLGRQWACAGIYLLLGDSGMTEPPYVGKSHDLLGRVGFQSRQRDDFARVLFVRRITPWGFTTGEIGRLEYHIAMLFALTLPGGPRNDNTPEGATIYPHEEAHALAYLDSLVAVLAVLGYGIDVEQLNRFASSPEEPDDNAPWRGSSPLDAQPTQSDKGRAA